MDIRLIGAALGLGAPDPGCADGPLALRAAGLHRHLAGRGLPARWDAMVRAPRHGIRHPVDAVAGACARVAAVTHRALRDGATPVVLGGDHSCAIGTWSGVAAAQRAPAGLIWIDAHLDAHTFETTPSGALHGMPLAALLGYGDARLTGILSTRPKLRPEHLVLIGARSWEAGERALLERLGVRIVYMDEVRARGMTTVLIEAATMLQAATGGIGLSIDLDALDPLDAPAVGSPVKNGIRAEELLAALAALAVTTPLVAVEIAELNPHLPGVTACISLIDELLAAALGTGRLASCPASAARISA